MDYSYLDSYKELQDRFDQSRQGGVVALINAGRVFETMKVEALGNIIHHHFGQWPETLINKPLLINACKRILQLKHYEIIYGNAPSKTVTQSNEEVFEQLKLTDKKPEIPDAKKIIKLKTPEPKRKKPKVYKVKPPKEKKPKTFFQNKASAMSTEELYNWAKDLKIPEDKIQRTKEKFKGAMQRMQIISLVKFKLKKEGEQKLFEVENYV